MSLKNRPASKMLGREIKLAKAKMWEDAKLPNYWTKVPAKEKCGFYLVKPKASPLVMKVKNIPFVLGV